MFAKRPLQREDAYSHMRHPGEEVEAEDVDRLLILKLCCDRYPKKVEETLGEVEIGRGSAESGRRREGGKGTSCLR